MKHLIKNGNKPYDLSKHPLWEEATKTTTYVPSKFAVQFKDDTAIMSLNVLGHEPKNVEINCF